MDYFGKINLLSLQNAEIFDKERPDGTFSRGIFIPIDDNMLTSSTVKRTCYLHFRMLERKPNPYMISHSIVPWIVGKHEAYHKYIDLYGNLPYIGDAKVGKSFGKINNPRKSLDDILG